MTIQIWFLFGLIISFLIIQLSRLIYKRTPNDFDITDWIIICCSILIFPIGILICLIGFILEVYEKTDGFKSIKNFFLKERKL